MLWMAVADPASFGIEYYYSMEPVSVLFLSAGGAGRQRPSPMIALVLIPPLLYLGGGCKKKRLPPDFFSPQIHHLLFSSMKLKNIMSAGSSIVIHSTYSLASMASPTRKHNSDTLSK